MKARSLILRLLAAATVSLSAMVPQLVAPAPAGAIDTGWTFEDAYHMAVRADDEPYTWGGSWFYNNDSFIYPCEEKPKTAREEKCGRDPKAFGHDWGGDAIATITEGPDCSGLGAKLWGVGGMNTSDRANQPHPYLARHWQTPRSYQGQLEWTHQSADNIQTLDSFAHKGHVMFFWYQPKGGKALFIEAIETREGTQMGNERDMSVVRKNFVPMKRAVWNHTPRQYQ